MKSLNLIVEFFCFRDKTYHKTLDFVNKGESKGILMLSLENQKSPVISYGNFVNASHYHVTLEYGLDASKLPKQVLDKIGKKVKVDVIANCNDDEIQALMINLPGEYKRLCKNKIPHMTISHKSGVKPFQSNAMLEKIAKHS